MVLPIHTHMHGFGTSVVAPVRNIAGIRHCRVEMEASWWDTDSLVITAYDMEAMVLEVKDRIKHLVLLFVGQEMGMLSKEDFESR